MKSSIRSQNILLGRKLELVREESMAKNNKTNQNALLVLENMGAKARELIESANAKQLKLYEDVLGQAYQIVSVMADKLGYFDNILSEKDHLLIDNLLTSLADPKIAKLNLLPCSLEMKSYKEILYPETKE